MHIDARELENRTEFEGDICIIGSGAAGISFALENLNSPFKIILLEGGGFEVESKMQDLYKGKTTGQRYFPLQSSRLHYFGGTTGHWSGFCSKYDPIDFKKRDWVPGSGWPIELSDIEPYYSRSNELLELGPNEYDVEYWLKKNKSLTKLPLNEDVIWNKVWQFSPPTRFGTKYRDEIVNSKNIHLYTYANVTEIETNEEVTSVKQVIVKNLEGKTHAVKAKQFIFACCAIQNARLLLASNKQAPKGLGNDHDQVGRNFMEHLEISSADLILPAPEALPLYTWKSFTVKMRAELAISEKIQEQLKILHGTVSFWPKEAGVEQKAMIDTFPDDAEATVKKWVDREKEFKGKEEGKEPVKQYKMYSLFTRIEQAPNPSSRITLDKDKDALGMPRTALHWEMTSLEKRSIRKIYELIGQQVGLSGIGRVRLMEWLHDEKDESWPSILGGGWHHMGTTRMHLNPKEGVVDENCKVHGIDNLYMSGSSCFTTAGAANPTLTLIALTLRLSDHIKNKMKIKDS